MHGPCGRFWWARVRDLYLGGGSLWWLIFGGRMQRRYLVFAGSLLLRSKKWPGLIPWGPSNWQRCSVRGIEGTLRGVTGAGHCGRCSMQLAMRGNLSALRLPWSPLLALRMQMFSDQSPSLMDGGLTLAQSGLNGAFLVGRCERSAGRPRPPRTALPKRRRGLNIG